MMMPSKDGGKSGCSERHWATPISRRQALPIEAALKTLGTIVPDRP